MAQTHLIVGAGNMGGALLSGWLDASIVAPRNIAILDPKPSGDAVYAIERGAKHLADIEEISDNVTTVLLAVKPQLFPQLRKKLADKIPESAVVISIMAGVSSRSLRAAFPKRDIIRAMPNTPASIGKGITAYVANPEVDANRMTAVEALLGTSGKVVSVESDDQINAVTAISGSGPAYIFHLCEALSQAAQSLGLPPHVAGELARETIIGSSALLDASERPPSELRQAVTSPGGTTQAALEVLMGNDGLSDLMRRTAQAALKRADELSG